MDIIFGAFLVKVKMIIPKKMNANMKSPIDMRPGEK